MKARVVLTGKTSHKIFIELPDDFDDCDTSILYNIISSYFVRNDWNDLVCGNVDNTLPSWMVNIIRSHRNYFLEFERSALLSVKVIAELTSNIFLLNHSHHKQLQYI